MKTFSFHTRSLVFCLCFVLAGCFTGLAYGQQTKGVGGQQAGIGQPNAAQQSGTQTCSQQEVCADQKAIDAAQAEISESLQILANTKEDLRVARTDLENFNKQLQAARTARNQKGVDDLQTKVKSLQQKISDLNNTILEKIRTISGQQHKQDIWRLQLQKDLDILARSGCHTPACVKRAAKQGPTTGASTTPASGDTVSKSTTGQGGSAPGAGAGLPTDN